MKTHYDIWNNHNQLRKHCFGCYHTRLGGVLCVIKDQYVTGWSLCSNDARVLRHVACSVHFSLMIDLYFNLYFSTY